MRSLYNCLLFLTFSGIGPLTAQVHDIVYPQDYTTNWVDIAIGEQGHGIAVGSCDLIALTDDGQNWTIADAPEGIKFRYASCLPGTNCGTILLASSLNSGSMARSTDGGLSWTTFNAPSFNVLVNHPTHIGQVGNEQYRFTTDGINWDTVPMPDRPRSEPVFLDENFGYCTSLSNLEWITTRDGGLTWNTEPSQVPIVTSSIYFRDLMTGWMAGGTGGTTLYRTDDGGANWQQVGEESDIRANYITGTGAEELLLWGFDSITYSPDGGVTLQTVSYIDRLSQGTLSTRPVFSNALGYWYPGNHGQIFYSPSIAEPFVELFPNLRPLMREAIFTDNNTALTISNEGQVFRSTDAGQNWAVLPASPGNNLLSLDQLPNGDLLVFGPELGLRTSSDNGNSWQLFLPFSLATQLSPDNQAFTVAPGGRMHVFSDSTAAYSDDDGATWTTVDIGAAQRATVVAFKNANKGIAIGNQSQFIHRTNDGGESWEMFVPGGDVPTNVRDVIFLDNNRIIATWEVFYYVSEDGGESWDRTTGIQTVRNIEAANDGTLYATGNQSSNYSSILRSTDQGLTWEQIGTQFCPQLQSTALSPDEKYLLSVGLGGTIVRTSLVDLLSDVVDPVVTEQLLYVYPNPVSETHLNVQLPTISEQSQSVTYSIFDLNGRRLLNGNATSSSGQLQIDVATLKNGFYTLRIHDTSGNVYLSKMLKQ